MPTDLITAAEIDPAEFPLFATLGPGTQAQLIAAGSRAVERECDRILGQSTQHQIETPGRQESFRLREYPVQSVLSVRAGLRHVISIGNVDPAAQRATVAFVTSGNPLDLAVVGLQLSATKSGVATPSTIQFSISRTLDALAAAVNVIPGWSAHVHEGGDAATGGWGPYATADLLPDMGVQQAKCRGGSTPANGGGVGLEMYSRDLRYGLDINGDSRTGRVTLFESFPDGYRFPDRQSSGSYGYGGGFGSHDGHGPDPRLGGVRVEYVAGFATADVPADLKQAAAMAAQYLFEATKQVGPIQSETIGGYSYSLASKAQQVQALPGEIAGLCAYYRRVELI